MNLNGIFMPKIDHMSLHGIFHQDCFRVVERLIFLTFLAHDDYSDSRLAGVMGIFMLQIRHLFLLTANPDQNAWSSFFLYWRRRAAVVCNDYWSSHLCSPF